MRSALFWLVTPLALSAGLSARGASAAAPGDGRTTAPNGVSHGASVSGSGPNGAYSPTMYGGYSAAGASGDAYRAGVVRYP